MGLGLFAVIELAGAFQHDVAAVPVQIIHVIGGIHLHRATAQIHGAIAQDDLAGETAVHAVVFDQMRGGLQRAGGVHLDHLDIVAARGCDMRQSAPADAAKPVDPDFDGHDKLH